jgi:thiamine-phosphate pyrophosphorylase
MAIAGGVTIVQLREKDLPIEEFTREAILFRKLTDRLGIPLIINDSIEVTQACRADGIHLGQEDMSCSMARSILGADKIIGISVGNVDEALQAAAAGADYLGISPIFDTPTKTDTPPAVGIEGLKEIRRRISLPIIGIGGISAGNAAEILRAGADGIAVVSAIMTAPDPQSAAGELNAICRQIRKQDVSCNPAK